MGLFDIFKKKNTDANVQNESAEETLDHETELKVAEQALKAVEKKTLTPCVRLELVDNRPSILRARLAEWAMFHMTALSQRTKRQTVKAAGSDSLFAGD